MIGERFGILRVVAQATRVPGPNGARAFCRCECGREVAVRVSNLRSGGTKSCGCARHAPTPLAERFWSKVSVDVVSGCWNWTASGNQKGYGHISIEGSRLTRAHHAAWLLAHFIIPDGMQVLHRCDNRRCVRPDHLFLGTHQDNMDDMIAKGRARNVPRPGSLNGFAKLNEMQVAEMRERHASGESIADLADVYEVTESNVACILRGKTWRHVPMAEK